MPILLTLIAIILLAFLLLRAARSNDNVIKSEMKVGLDHELLRLCHGNADLASRLLNYELEENPNLPRNKALKLAIERIKRDR